METNEKKLCDQMFSLINENGPVYVWENEDGVLSYPHRFSSEENAMKFAVLRNDYCRMHELPEYLYIIGTEEEYQKAQRDFLKSKRAKQVKDYSAYVDKLVKREQHEIKALNALQKVCKKFDGKVINKRFTDAVSEASGLRCSFAEYFKCTLDLKYFGHEYGDQLKPYVRIFGSKTKECDSVGRLYWLWAVGDRLNADKADSVIDYYINDRLNRIVELTHTIKQYSAYLDLAEKAAELVRELNGYDSTLQQWAREHGDTDTDVMASRVWRS